MNHTTHMEVRKSQRRIALLLLPVMLVDSVWRRMLSVSEAWTCQMLDEHDGRPDGPDGPGRVRRVRTGLDGSGRVRTAGRLDGRVRTDGRLDERTDGWTDG